MKNCGSDVDSDEVSEYRCIEIQLPAIIFMYKVGSTQSCLVYQKLPFRSLKYHNRLRHGATTIFKNNLTIVAEESAAFTHIYPTKPTL